MRSRYSAYALNLSVYIMETTHPESSAFNADTMKWWRELDFFSKTTRFVGLKILTAEGDTVTFRATLFSGARDVSFTERSTFKMHDGKWKYFSGEQV